MKSHQIVRGKNKHAFNQSAIFLRETMVAIVICYENARKKKKEKKIIVKKALYTGRTLRYYALCMYLVLTE